MILVVLVLALGASGCATRGFTLSPGDEALRGHYILAHEDGWPAATDREPLEHEAYQSQIAAILDGIDAHALAARTRGEPARLLIFAHGGLNGYADDFARMRSLMIGSGGDGLFPKTSYYPIFINWNSALGDSLMDDLFFVRFGRRRPVLALLTAPFALAARLAESVFNAPSSLWANTWNFDELDPGVTDWAEAIGKWPVTVVMTPVLKAFGTSAWQIMKRRADLLVASLLDGNPAGAEEGAGCSTRRGSTWRPSRDRPLRGAQAFSSSGVIGSGTGRLRRAERSSALVSMSRLWPSAAVAWGVERPSATRESQELVSSRIGPQSSPSAMLPGG